jgi:RND family efflux transporter MFP subunit
MKVVVSLSLAAVLLVNGCSKSKDAGAASATDGAPPTPVEVAAAERTAIHSSVTAEGILYPLQQANVVPKISAPVARFLAQRGDHVKEGQLLAVLENRDLAAAAREGQQLYEQAQANFQTTTAATMPEDMTKAKADFEAARQAMDVAQRLYNNRKELFAQGALAQKLVDDANVSLVQARSLLATTQQHLDSLRTVGQAEQLKSATAQMDAAKAHYESTAAQAAYAEVRSPMTGAVSDRPVNVGEMASAGSALFTIVDLSRVVARANVAVQEAARVTSNRPAIISAEGVELKGKVLVVSPAVDPNTTTVQIWVEAPNPGERLKLGSTVQISIDTGEIPNAIVVPVAALLASDEGGEKVMVAGADGLAHEQPVKVGIRSGTDAQILSGVKEGDNVIVQGALGLDDKSKIEVAKAGANSDTDQKSGGDKQ